jgi:hypothetical protein
MITNRFPGSVAEGDAGGAYREILIGRGIKIGRQVASRSPRDAVGRGNRFTQGAYSQEF